MGVSQNNNTNSHPNNKENNPQAPGRDLPGVIVIGTGGLGENALKIIIGVGGFLQVSKGQYFEPKDGGYQRMIVSESKNFNTPGTYFINAHCMQKEKSTPATTTYFFSKPKNGTDETVRCQARCGSQQSCVWGCQTDPNTQPSGPMTLSLSDGCRDGKGLHARFFDESNQLIWPNSSQVYVTNNEGGTITQKIDCRAGSKICYGATPAEDSPSTYWGVGIEGKESCSECCVMCKENTTFSWNLTCN